MKYYIHNCENTHTMEVNAELVKRIIESPAWFVNQCGRDYDAESPDGKLFCIMVREKAVSFGTNGFDWTEHTTWM